MSFLDNTGLARLWSNTKAALSKKEDVFIEITKAEYDALSAEVRNANNYIITDFDSNAIDGVAREAIVNAHTQFLKTLPVNGWTLQGAGTWDGYYANELSITSIYNPSGNVDARGNDLATPATDEVKAAVARMFFKVDDVAMTLTAYTKTAPTIACNISVEGIK